MAGLFVPGGLYQRADYMQPGRPVLRCVISVQVHRQATSGWTDQTTRPHPAYQTLVGVPGGSCRAPPHRRAVKPTSTDGLVLVGAATMTDLRLAGMRPLVRLGPHVVCCIINELLSLLGHRLPPAPVTHRAGLLVRQHEGDELDQ